MPRLPLLNAPEAAPTESNFNIQSGKALQDLGATISDLAIEHGVRIKKQQDDNFVYEVRANLFRRADENLMRLKKERPYGGGIADEQKKFIENELKSIEKRAPSETARRNLANSSQPHLDAHIFGAISDEQKVISIKAVENLDDGMLSDANDLVVNPSPDGFFEKRNRTVERIESMISNGEVAPEQGAKLRKNSRVFASAMADGMIAQMESAKSVGQKRVIGNQIMSYIDRNGKGLNAGMLAEDLTPDQVSTIQRSIQRELERAQKEKKSEAFDKARAYTSVLKAGGKSSEYQGDYNSVVSLVRDSGMEQKDATMILSSVNAERARSEVLSDSILNSPTGNLDEMVSEYEKRYSALNEASGVKKSIYSEENRLEARARLSSGLDALKQKRDEHLGNFLEANDPNVRNLADQVLKESASGGVELTTWAVDELMQYTENRANFLGSSDSRRLPDSVAMNIGKAISHGGPQADQILSSIDQLPLERKNQLIDQLMKDQKIDGMAFIAPLMSTEDARQTVTRNSTIKDFSERSAKAHAIWQEGEPEVRRQMNEDPDIQKIRAVYGTSVGLAVESAWKQEAINQTLANRSNTVSGALELAKKKLDLSNMGLVEIKANERTSFIKMPGKVDGMTKTLIQDNIHALTTEGALKDFGVVVPEDFKMDFKEANEQALKGQRGKGGIPIVPYLRSTYSDEDIDKAYRKIVSRSIEFVTDQDDPSYVIGKVYSDTGVAQTIVYKKDGKQVPYRFKINDVLHSDYKNKYGGMEQVRESEDLETMRGLREAQMGL